MPVLSLRELIKKSVQKLRRITVVAVRAVGNALSPYRYQWSSEKLQRLTSRRPKTYIEKVRYKMARDRRETLTLFADKVAVRDFIADNLGTGVLTELYCVHQDPEQINWKFLPKEFVVKVNHGSKGMIVVTENAPRGNLIPPVTSPLIWTGFAVHPESFDPQAANSWLRAWLGEKYNWSPHNYTEWAYSKIPPLVFIEEYVGGRNLLAKNLKIHCFNGKPATLLISRLDSTFTETVEDKYLASEIDVAAQNTKVPQAILHNALVYSTKLSGGTDMVRVDWLLTDSGLVFSEMTNYPSGGQFDPGPAKNFSAQEINDLYYSAWKLPKKYS